MNTKQEVKLLIDYLENNKAKVLAFVKENTGYKGSSIYAFAMIGQHEDSDVILSTAQATDHFTRTNIQLGRFLTLRRLDQIIASQKVEMEIIPEGW